MRQGPYPLDALLDAVDAYHQDSGRKCLVQYILLGGVNDGLAQVCFPGSGSRQSLDSSTKTA